MKILNQAAKEENIIFLHPVKLSKIAGSKAIKDSFCKLKLSKTNKLNYINDLGNSFEGATKMIDFLSEVSKRNPTLKYKPPVFKIITKDH